MLMFFRTKDYVAYSASFFVVCSFLKIPFCSSEHHLHAIAVFQILRCTSSSNFIRVGDPCKFIVTFIIVYVKLPWPVLLKDCFLTAVVEQYLLIQNDGETSMKVNIIISNAKYKEIKIPEHHAKKVLVVNLCWIFTRTVKPFFKVG